MSEAHARAADTRHAARPAARAAEKRFELFPGRPDPSAPVPLDTLAALAWTLEPPSPADLPSLRRDDAALLLDGLLVRLARGRGALEVAIGEGLAALSEGDRALRLGYSSLGDYARERLGVAGSTAEKLARLARALRDRPLLAGAVRRGEVSARKTETVLPLARSEDEGAWVARARAETVRSLEAAVRSERPGSEPEEDERWERVLVSLAPEARERLDRALELAGRQLGATAPRWQRLEALCAEFLGAHPPPPPGDRPDATRHPTAQAEADGLKAWLEEETAHWEFLESIEPCPAPAAEPGEAPGPRGDPWRLDQDLRRLAGMRVRWDEVFGHVAMLLRLCGVWRDMQFASFGHYCAERLGMAERTVGQRIALERRLYDLPALRVALREGRVSYEQARLVARAAPDDRAAAGWIGRAERLPCVALRREVEAWEEARDDAGERPGGGGSPQMCAHPALDLRLPTRVAALLDDALRAARAAAGRWLRPGECLDAVARHFLDTWEATGAERSTVRRRVLARDRGRCQVPGCSRAAVHAHHVLYRSRGGDDGAANLVSLCAAHHLHGVHRGWIRVRGRAPDGLTWELGVRAGAPPLQAFPP